MLVGYLLESAQGMLLGYFQNQMLIPIPFRLGHIGHVLYLA